jgi:hypothetical protein
MIFSETMKKYNSDVKEAVDELFINAENAQKNENDILVVYIHGYQDIEHKEDLQSNGLSEFVFGPNLVGLCKDRFYEFFDVYRHQIISKKSFQEMINKDKESTKLQERISVDLELLMYLKFWESELILRQLFNLKNLALGLDYDWTFNHKKFKWRKTLIENEILAPLKNICPKFCELVEGIYSSQIRNAVAHSKYFFQGRNLQLANKNDSTSYILYNIPFEEWEVTIHKILLLYNHIIGNFNRINNEHAKRANEMHNGLPLRIPKKSKHGLFKNQWVVYDEVYKRWLWNA